jgi:hypothetical protein
LAIASNEQIPAQATKPDLRIIRRDRFSLFIFHLTFNDFFNRAASPVFDYTIAVILCLMVPTGKLFFEADLFIAEAAENAEDSGNQSARSRIAISRE